MFTSVGDRSDFDRQWIGPGQNYDIFAVYYGDDDARFARYRARVDWITRRQGSKFQNFRHLYHAHPDLIGAYRRFFILDDDLEFHGGVAAINRMFEVSRRYRLDICGPSFTPDGKVSHAINAHRPGCTLAYTNFVEVNAPLFSRTALDRLMRRLDPDLIGWGVDYLAIWANGLRKRKRYAVVHEVRCRNPHDHDRHEQRELDRLPGAARRRDTWAEYARSIGCPVSFEHVEYGTSGVGEAASGERERQEFEPGDGPEGRIRSLLQRVRGDLDAYRAQRRLLADSVAWRTVGPLLRTWMSPRTLGRGRTLLGDLDRQLDALATDFAALETDLLPPGVRWEASDRALERARPVSILVTNRDGAPALAAFLASYAEHHEADAAELVILDHASSDDSVAVVREWMERLPIQLLRCDRNQRFSVANNLARRYAVGEYLVFANNDVVFDEPVIPALVAALDGGRVGLAGVELWYPDERGQRSERRQHGGIRFRPDPVVGFQRPFNDASGPVRREADLAATTPRAVPAVTAALAACRREDFDAVGGFVPEYDYGFEDVDLALSLRRELGKGSVLCPVGAVHREFGTQAREDEARLQARRAANARLLRRRHGAWLARCVVASQLGPAQGADADGEGVPWGEAPLPVRLPPGRPLPDAPPRGLRPSPGRADDVPDTFAGVWLLDAPAELESPPPRTALSIARVRRGSAGAWRAAPALRHLDAMLFEAAEDRDALAPHTRAVLLMEPAAGEDAFAGLAGLPGLLRSLIARPGIALQTATPAEEERESWGDFHFAEGVGRALRDLGYRVRVDVHPDWGRPAFTPDDVTLVLRGLEASRPPLDGLRLLWLISHPQRVTDAELEAFDHVFVASEYYAGVLGARLRTPVSPLLQCTDPQRFPFVDTPGSPERRLFVGNSKGYYRPIVRAALAAGEKVDIWGTWWHEHIDPALVRGENVPNDALGALYGDSGVVLNDHWPDMARLGFLSNRLFDAAATGTLVVTDRVRGLEALFGDAVLIADDLPERLPTWTEAQVMDRAARRALAEEIAGRHTFAARAAEIDRVVRRLRPELFQSDSSPTSD